MNKLVRYSTIVFLLMMFSWLFYFEKVHGFKLFESISRNILVYISMGLDFDKIMNEVFFAAMCFPLIIFYLYIIINKIDIKHHALYKSTIVFLVCFFIVCTILTVVDSKRRDEFLNDLFLSYVLLIIFFSVYILTNGKKNSKNGENKSQRIVKSN